MKSVHFKILRMVSYVSFFDRWFPTLHYHGPVTQYPTPPIPATITIITINNETIFNIFEKEKEYAIINHEMLFEILNESEIINERE